MIKMDSGDSQTVYHILQIPKRKLHDTKIFKIKCIAPQDEHYRSDASRTVIVTAVHISCENFIICSWVIIMTSYWNLLMVHYTVNILERLMSNALKPLTLVRDPYIGYYLAFLWKLTYVFIINKQKSLNCSNTISLWQVLLLL